MLGAPFTSFLVLSDWLFARVRRTDTIALLRLMELLFEFFTRERGLDAHLTAQILWRDYQRGGRRERPGFLAEYLPENERPLGNRARTGPKRQSRHVAV